MRDVHGHAVPDLRWPQPVVRVSCRDDVLANIKSASKSVFHRHLDSEPEGPSDKKPEEHHSSIIHSACRPIPLTGSFQHLIVAETTRIFSEA